MGPITVIDWLKIERKLCLTTNPSATSLKRLYVSLIKSCRNGCLLHERTVTVSKVRPFTFHPKGELFGFFHSSHGTLFMFWSYFRACKSGTTDHEIQIIRQARWIPFSNCEFLFHISQDATTQSYWVYHSWYDTLEHVFLVLTDGYQQATQTGISVVMFKFWWPLRIG